MVCLVSNRNFLQISTFLTTIENFAKDRIFASRGILLEFISVMKIAPKPGQSNLVYITTLFMFWDYVLRHRNKFQHTNNQRLAFFLFFYIYIFIQFRLHEFLLTCRSISHCTCVRIYLHTNIDSANNCIIFFVYSCQLLELIKHI